MNLSSNNITFLRDVPSDIRVDMTSNWDYHQFDGSISDFSIFLKSIEDDKIYLVIPLFVGSESLRDAVLHLSQPFLVDSKSNSPLIIEFILEQWKSSAFEFKVDSRITFFIKFKRVWFNYKILPF